jgi:hypothetical protein
VSTLPIFHSVLSVDSATFAVTDTKLKGRQLIRRGAPALGQAPGSEAPQSGLMSRILGLVARVEKANV